MGIPPIHRVDRVPANEHGEVQVIAAGQTRHSTSSERLPLDDRIADLDVNRDELATLVAAPGANGGYLALLRFLLGGVGNDYTREAVGNSLVSSCGFVKSLADL